MGFPGRYSCSPGTAGEDSRPDMPCIPLEGAILRVQRQPVERCLLRDPALLNDVGQLVGEQFLPVQASRLVLLMREDDIAAHRVGQSIHRTGRFRCPGIRMDAHPAKILAEAGFHETARSRVERLSRRLQYFMNQV